MQGYRAARGGTLLGFEFRSPDSPEDYPPRGKRAKRQTALDGLRGIAILAVMVFHFAMHEHSKWWLGKVVLKVLSVGWAGVDLFFALSGFLITGILLDTKDDPRFFRNFYARRALRIFPLYYAVLAASMIAVGITFDTRGEAVRELFRRQVWLWTYSANIADAIAGRWVWNAGRLFLNHVWSLAVEEQFYLCWPILVWALSRRALANTAVFIVLAAPLLRAVLVARGVPPTTVYSFTLCRFDELALGGLAAILARDPILSKKISRALPFLVGSSVAALLAIAAARRGLYWLDPVVHVGALSPLAVLSSASLLFVSSHPAARGVRLLENSVLRFFGKYSYAAYLFHYMLWPFLARICPSSRMATVTGSESLGSLGFVTLGILGSIGAAFVSYHAFERHFLRWKDRFESGVAPAGARSDRESPGNPRVTGKGGDTEPRDVRQSSASSCSRRIQ